MDPARSIIERLGGAAVVARITGTSYTAPYRWQHSREKGGTNGLIPQKYHRTLIEYGRSIGECLSYGDFAEVDPTGKAA